MYENLVTRKPGFPVCSYLGSLDTIKIGIEISQDDIDLTGWIKKSYALVRKDHQLTLREEYSKTIPISDDVTIRLFYYTHTFDGEPFNTLFAELSLPKIVFGNNYRELLNFDAGYDKLNEIIASIPGLPVLPDVRSWTLFSADLCCNYKVGELVPHYIEVLHRSHYPARKRMPYWPTGVRFQTEEESCTFYWKMVECGHPDAYGLLRHEIRLRKKRRIAKLLDVKNPTLRDLSQGKIRDLLINDLRKLCLDKPVLGNQLQIEEHLSRQYKPCKVRNILGYLTVRNTNTREQMKAKGYTSRTISHYEKMISYAGISSLSFNDNVELPALIDQFDDKGIPQ